ncbi:MAG TPA: pitrilysin family protein [Acidimicrobiales bacterium]|jgi:predicted Zn-dependent peptidase|nr:pitrilysin family protein [Acidimicrobiales bacterium]
MTLVEQRPASGPPREWRFPAFERRRLDSGLHLILCHLPGRPMTAARVVLEAGAATEPAGQGGLAALAARSLSEGTEALDAHAFAEATEALGAEVRGEVSWDAMHVRLDVPAGRLAPALALLADVVRRPGFRPAEVERVRTERLDQLAQEKVDPSALAGKSFSRAVFVPDAAYARPLQGTEASVGGLDRDAIAEFYAGRLSSATLIVVGDLSGVDGPKLAEPLFGSWDVDGAPAVSPVVDEAGGGRRIVLVDRPGSVQSALSIGHAGPRRAIPDYVPVGTMAMVLGGVFGSRLNMKLREEKGYTYGAQAGFDFRRHGGAFAARSAVRTEDTAAAVADAVGEIVRTHAEGIPEDELAPVREYRVGVYPIAYERPASIAMGLADLVTHGLPDGWFDRMRAEIAGVSAEDVSAAAAARLRPDDLAIVVVGDAERIRGELEATGLGPVHDTPAP